MLRVHSLRCAFVDHSYWLPMTVVSHFIEANAEQFEFFTPIYWLDKKWDSSTLFIAHRWLLPGGNKASRSSRDDDFIPAGCDNFTSSHLHKGCNSVQSGVDHSSSKSSSMQISKCSALLLNFHRMAAPRKVFRWADTSLRSLQPCRGEARSFGHNSTEATIYLSLKHQAPPEKYDKHANSLDRISFASSKRGEEDLAAKGRGHLVTALNIISRRGWSAAKLG